MEDVVESTSHLVDDLESYMLDNLELMEAPVTHTFTPRLYTREIFMYAGSLIVSKIHLTEHPYSVLSGKANVYTLDGEVVSLSAGHSGVTLPHTRRVLYIEEDCRWCTHHVLSDEEEKARLDGASEDELLAMIESRIIETHLIEGTNTSTYELYQDKLKERLL